MWQVEKALSSEQLIHLTKSTGNRLFFAKIANKVFFFCASALKCAGDRKPHNTCKAGEPRRE